MTPNNTYILKTVEKNNQILWFKCSSVKELFQYLNEKYGLNREIEERER